MSECLKNIEPDHRVLENDTSTISCENCGKYFPSEHLKSHSKDCNVLPAFPKQNMIKNIDRKIVDVSSQSLTLNPADIPEA